MTDAAASLDALERAYNAVAGEHGQRHRDGLLAVAEHIRAEVQAAAAAEAAAVRAAAEAVVEALFFPGLMAEIIGPERRHARKLLGDLAAALKGGGGDGE